MIPRGVERFIGLEPIDLRWGFDRHAGVVAERAGREPRGGALFVFFGEERRTAIEVLSDAGEGEPDHAVEEHEDQAQPGDEDGFARGQGSGLI